MICLIFFISGFALISAAEVHGPFTDDFRNWLDVSGYADYNFPALYLGEHASYGGRSVPNSPLKNRPVIFIHGNSDGALDAGATYNSGWSASIEYFLQQGYQSSELYALTWGDRNLNKSYTRTHSCATMLRIRRFVEAVISYTNSSHIDIIAHSMGVTLGRQIVRGGIWKDDIELCALGDPLNEKVKTFLGIGGANYGLCLCNGELADRFAACGRVTGFYAGDSCQKVPKSPFSKQSPTVTGNTCSGTVAGTPCKTEYSSMLMQLNHNSLFKEAEKVYSFWSDEDEVIGTNLVWGRSTSKIPNSDESMVFNGLNHHDLKRNTAQSQHLAVTGSLFDLAR